MGILLHAKNCFKHTQTIEFSKKVNSLWAQNKTKQKIKSKQKPNQTPVKRLFHRISVIRLRHGNTYQNFLMKTISKKTKRNMGYIENVQLAQSRACFLHL